VIIKLGLLSILNEIKLILLIKILLTLNVHCFILREWLCSKLVKLQFSICYEHLKPHAVSCPYNVNIIWGNVVQNNFSNFVAVFNIKLLIFQLIGVTLIIFFKNLHYRTMHSLNIHIKLKSSNTNPTENRVELRCSGRVSSSCSTSDTSRVNLVTNPVISHERGNDRELFTTNGTYPWSFVTQIFHNSQPSRGGDRQTFEVMTST
jgi:hypothetical protein